MVIASEGGGGGGKGMEVGGDWIHPQPRCRLITVPTSTPPSTPPALATPEMFSMRPFIRAITRSECCGYLISL